MTWERSAPSLDGPCMQMWKVLCAVCRTSCSAAHGSWYHGRCKVLTVLSTPCRPRLVLNGAQCTVYHSTATVATCHRKIVNVSQQTLPSFCILHFASHPAVSFPTNHTCSSRCTVCQRKPRLVLQVVCMLLMRSFFGGSRLDRAAQFLFQGQLGALQPLELDQLQRHCDGCVVTLTTFPDLLLLATQSRITDAMCVLAYPWALEDPSEVVSPAVRAMQMVLQGNRGKVACVVCDAWVLQESGACRGTPCGALVLFGPRGLLCPDVVARGPCPAPPHSLEAVVVATLGGAPCVATVTAGTASRGSGCTCRAVLTWRWDPCVWPGDVSVSRSSSPAHCLWEITISTQVPERAEGAEGADATVASVATESLPVVWSGVVSVSSIDAGRVHPYGAVVTGGGAGDHCARMTVPDPENEGSSGFQLHPGALYLCSVRSVDAACRLCSSWVRVVLHH